MKFETKFNVDDTVFFMKNNEPNSQKVIGITCFTGKNHINNSGSTFMAENLITYHLLNRINIIEAGCFASIQELKDHVFNSKK